MITSNMEERIGSVIKFFDKNSIAAVKLDFGELAVGDTIHVKGNNYGLSPRSLRPWSSITSLSRKPSADNSPVSSSPSRQSPSTLFTR